MGKITQTLRITAKHIFVAWSVILVFVICISLLPTSAIYNYEFPFRDNIGMLQQKMAQDLLLVSEVAPHRSIDLSLSSAVDVVGIWLRYTTLVFVRNFTTILLIVGFQQFSNGLLVGLYILLPDWLTDITDNMTEAIVTSFSADEGDPPFLELDSRLIHLKEEENKDVCDSSFLEKFRNDAASNIVDQGDHSGGVAEQYVFDPKFGVIPASCSDTWKQQLEEMEKKIPSKSDGEKKRINIPPVRFTSVQMN